ncbi:uncharacterized protein LOC126264953 [Aethina tumida]|uniref:uncharacterized protein LOC126264953 n=1 Tax=Aethina tumida TaxID=116153 RepID=UPI0021481E17|nr:uncharacterized protein LOC126264953 [Aethina tumida]
MHSQLKSRNFGKMFSAIFVMSLCLCYGDTLVIQDSGGEYERQEDGGFSSTDNQNAANHYVDTLPGDPDLDYPTYRDIPRTAFSCQGKVNWRYYADIDTGCQVFHVCETQYSKISFLCPIGSIFNQKHLVCDWWYNVDCSGAESLYTLRLQSNEADEQDEPEDRTGFDLSPAFSGGNVDPATSKLKEAENGKSPNRRRV